MGFFRDEYRGAAELLYQAMVSSSQIAVHSHTLHIPLPFSSQTKRGFAVVNNCGIISVVCGSIPTTPTPTMYILHTRISVMDPLSTGYYGLLVLTLLPSNVQTHTLMGHYSSWSRVDKCLRLVHVLVGHYITTNDGPGYIGIACCHGHGVAYPAVIKHYLRKCKPKAYRM